MASYRKTDELNFRRQNITETNNCATHPSSPAVALCRPCNKLCCLECSLNDHNVHEKCSIDVALKEKSREVKSLVPALESNLTSLGRQLQKIQAQSGGMKDSKERGRDLLIQKRSMAKMRLTDEYDKSVQFLKTDLEENKDGLDKEFLKEEQAFVARCNAREVEIREAVKDINRAMEQVRDAVAACQALARSPAACVPEVLRVLNQGKKAVEVRVISNALANENPSLQATASQHTALSVEVVLKKQTAGEEQSTASNSVVHHNIVCDGCKAEPLVGRRYKCVVCLDYDLCSTCEATGTHDHHTMVRFTSPAMAPDASSTGAVHRVTCKECRNTPIVGNRYKCTVCSDYDLCSACEMKGVHKEHDMIRCSAPKKTAPSFTSPHPSSSTGAQPRSQGGEVRHMGINCDVCNVNPIVGVRYKCRSCQAFDVCASCKAAGVHNHHEFRRITEAQQIDPSMLLLAGLLNMHGRQ